MQKLVLLSPCIILLLSQHRATRPPMFIPASFPECSLPSTRQFKVLVLRVITLTLLGIERAVVVVGQHYTCMQNLRRIPVGQSEETISCLSGQGRDRYLPECGLIRCTPSKIAFLVLHVFVFIWLSRPLCKNIISFRSPHKQSCSRNFFSNHLRRSFYLSSVVQSTECAIVIQALG